MATLSKIVTDQSYNSKERTESSSILIDQSIFIYLFSPKATKPFYTIERLKKEFPLSNYICPPMQLFEMLGFETKHLNFIHFDKEIREICKSFSQLDTTKIISLVTDLRDLFISFRKKLLQSEELSFESCCLKIKSFKNRYNVQKNDPRKDLIESLVEHLQESKLQLLLHCWTLNLSFNRACAIFAQLSNENTIKNDTVKYSTRLASYETLATLWYLYLRQLGCTASKLLYRWSIHFRERYTKVPDPLDIKSKYHERDLGDSEVIDYVLFGSSLSSKPIPVLALTSDCPIAIKHRIKQSNLALQRLQQIDVPEGKSPNISVLSGSVIVFNKVNINEYQPLKERERIDVSKLIEI